MRISGFRMLRRAVAALCERRRQKEKFDSSAVMCVFSAKGVMFNYSLGQRPKKTVNANALALTVRFIAALSRAFSARSLCNLKSWGVASGCEQSALSALNRSAGRPYNRCDSMAAAFSLVELVLALGVAGFCLFAVFGLMPVGMQTNRNATSQTAATNIIGGIVADLRATSAAATTSPQFAITFGTGKTLYFDVSGQASTSLTTDSRYRLNITWNSAPTGLHYAALKVTWPAAADPAITTPSGSVEIFAAFDRS